MAHMSAPDTPPGLFSEPPEDKHFPTTAVSIAAVAVAILVTVLVLIARRPAVAPPTVNASYGPNLELSGIQMSEADSQTGGRLIYIDGRVTNHGTATITGVRVQVTFPDDLSQPPQVETVPMNVVDTRPIAASPIAAGQAVDFRLIFDDINENWNQQQPDFKIAQVTTK
jgi:hypothetical protein